MNLLRCDFQVLSGAGVVIRTFGERDAAVKWAKANADRLPGLTVDHVEVLEQRTRVYRPRAGAQTERAYA